MFTRVQVSSTGVLRLQNAPDLVDFENGEDFINATRAVPVKVCDAGGLCDSTSVVVQLANVNEGQYMPLDVGEYTPSSNTLALSINAQVPVGTFVEQAIRVQDYDQDDVLYYTVVPGSQKAYSPLDAVTAADYFDVELSSTSGGVNRLKVVKGDGLPGVDALSRVELQLQVSDKEFSPPFLVNVVVFIRFNNEAPTLTLPSFVSVPEDSGVNQLVFSLASESCLQDQDSWQTHVFRLNSSDPVLKRFFTVGYATGDVSVEVACGCLQLFL